MFFGIKPLIRPLSALPFEVAVVHILAVLQVGSCRRTRACGGNGLVVGGGEKQCNLQAPVRHCSSRRATTPNAPLLEKRQQAMAMTRAAGPTLDKPLPIGRGLWSSGGYPRPSF